MGFGVATAAGLRGLGSTTRVGTSVVDQGDTDTDTVSAADDTTESPATTQPVVTAFEAPVFDTSFALAEGQSAAVALTGGRIIDPETGFDRIGNIAMLDGRIVAISDEPIAADQTIDVAGLVISPGFIDILSYTPNGYGEWFKVADGVTSNMAMHGLQFEPTAFYNRWTGEGSPVHFGGAAHSTSVRNSLGFGPDQEAEGADITTIAEAMEAQVRSGFIGIHAQPEYAPGISQLELLDFGRIAAELDVPLCVHARYSDNFAPGLQSEATAELVQVARETGAHVHVEHINSTGGTGRMAEALGEVQAAIDEGLRITTCMYPYEFWATTLKSARFRNWQEKFGLSYNDLQVAGTSERLTEATFGAAYDQNLLTAAFAIPPGDIELGFQQDFMIIGSDAILEISHNNHPRSTGCFARALGFYSREQQIVSLPNALAMMTIRPAKMLGIGAPDMRRKGRMQIGADADVTVFDPLTIRDQSSIADPAQESVGVQHVFVLGEAVRTNGVNTTARPGTAIRSAIV